MEGTLASCRQDIHELGVCKVSQAFTGISAFLSTCYFVHAWNALLPVPSFTPQTKPLLWEIPFILQGSAQASPER